MLPLLLTLALTAPQNTKDPRPLLAGTWRVQHADHDGAKEPLPEGGVKWVINDNLLCEVWIGRSKAETQQLVLDPAKSPKTLEARPPGGVRGHRLKGIYQLDADTLKVCYDLTGQNYPNDFTAPQGARRISYLLKRE